MSSGTGLRSCHEESGPVTRPNQPHYSQSRPLPLGLGPRNLAAAAAGLQPLGSQTPSLPCGERDPHSKTVPPSWGPANLGLKPRAPHWAQITYDPEAPFSPVRGVQGFPCHQASDTVGPVGHKQRGSDIRRIRGVGRAGDLGLLQHLTTASSVNPTHLGSHPGLRALRGLGALTWSSCPARGLESLSDPRTSSRNQGRRTTLPKLAIPAAKFSGAPPA